MQKATPLQAFTYKNMRVLVKREDKNTTGSHKDRGIWPLIGYYSQRAKSKKRRFVLSSSGNAAMSAAYYCQRHGLTLDVFVGKKVPREKARRLQGFCHFRRDGEFQQRQPKQKDFNPFAFWDFVSERGMAGDGRVTIHQTLFPRRDAFRFAKETGAQLISTSTDHRCLDGYAEIVKELPKGIDAIFVPASSGALAVGLYRGYKSKVKKNVPRSTFHVPRFFVCQTPRVHPLIDVVSAQGNSIADAISDVIGERRHEIQSIIQKTGGAGVIVDNRYIRKAREILKRRLKIAKPSPNGSLALAGLLKMSESGMNLEGQKIVCFYTGM